jgi:hypothetical protein
VNPRSLFTDGHFEALAMKAFQVKWRVVAALVLPLLVATALVAALSWPPEISPEQARAALLRLGSLRVITGGDDDPIALDLKSGAVARTNGSVVTIGRFFSCNLKETTWEMSVSNRGLRFAAGAKGKFIFQWDGTWLAIETSSYIT